MTINLKTSDAVFLGLKNSLKSHLLSLNTLGSNGLKATLYLADYWVNPEASLDLNL